MSTSAQQQLKARMDDIALKLGMQLMADRSGKWGDGTREYGYTVLDLEKGRVLVDLSLPVEGMPDDLWLQAEGYTSALLDEGGLEEIEVGEADFDDAFWIATLEPAPVLAWLTPERRELMLNLFLEKDLHLMGGRVVLSETLTGPNLESVEKAWELLRRTRDLLIHPPPIQPRSAPRGVNRRQRAKIFQPLFLAAAVCAAATLLIPMPMGQAGLGCIAAWLAATAVAWWKGHQEAYAMLKVSRWLVTLLALALTAGLIGWQYRQGESTDAFINTLVAGIVLLVGNQLLEVKMIAASRIRLGKAGRRSRMRNRT